MLTHPITARGTSSGVSLDPTATRRPPCQQLPVARSKRLGRGPAGCVPKHRVTATVTHLGPAAVGGDIGQARQRVPGLRPSAEHPADLPGAPPCRASQRWGPTPTRRRRSPRTRTVDHTATGAAIDSEVVPPCPPRVHRTRACSAWLSRCSRDHPSIRGWSEGGCHRSLVSAPRRRTSS